MRNLFNILAVAGAMFCTPTMSSAEWTLDECVDYAVTHNITVQQRELDVRSARDAVTSAQDAFLPQVSAGASQSWNFGRGLTAENTYANRNTSSFGWNVGMNLPLFQGLQNVRQVEYARTSLLAITEALEGAKDDVTLRVMAQYLQALYARELVGVAEGQVRLAEDELAKRQALLEVGRIPEADMLDAQSQLAQARLQAVNAENDRRLALLDLTQLLRLPAEEAAEFDVVPLADDDVRLTNPQQVYDNALTFNHTVQTQRLQTLAADKQVKVAQSGWLPRLNLSAGLSSNYYTLSGMKSESFGAQMRHNFGKYIGLNLSVPVFDAFSTRNAVRRARVQRLSAELALESSMDELYKAVNQAYLQAIGARERYVAATAAVKATEEALAAAQEKYNVDRATATDFETARQAYVRAATECAQAKYEMLLRARVLDFYSSND